MSDLPKYAIIVAGGSGTRMGADIPKQFLLIKGKPLFKYAVEAFLSSFEDLHVVLVVPEAFVDPDKLGVRDTKRVSIVKGGSTRFESVKNGLKLVTKESIVFVHDAARCLVSPSLIQRCYEQALIKGSAVPAICSKDSVRLLDENGSRPYDRNKVMLVQTPQTFVSSILLPAFEINYDTSFTDEATVVEANGIPVHLIPGDENNIKITRPSDLIVAESLL